MAFELRAHTADVAVAASAATLEGVFAAVANGLAAASCEDVPDDGAGVADGEDSNDGDSLDGRERFDLSVTAESREALLFDYLDELIYLRDVRVELPVDNRVERLERTDGNERTDGDERTDEEWTLEATARGVPLSELDAREIKAVTYSEMRLEERDGSWESYVVFDV